MLLLDKLREIMKIIRSPILILLISIIMTLPTTKISTAQNNFLAISGQVNHIDAKKVPEELLINLKQSKEISKGSQIGRQTSHPQREKNA